MKHSDNVIPLFSTPIFWENDVGYRLNDSEKECITNLLGSLYQNTHTSLSNDIYVLENLALKNIRELCQKYLDTYSKKILRIKQNFYITNSWLTIKNKGQHHHIHDHQNCIFSGVFYASANLNMSGLTFHGKPGYLSNFNFYYDYDECNIFNCSNWTLPVKTGTIIIFPSHVQHSVDENCDDDSRVVIGFNSFVKGEFGMKECEPYCSQLRL